MSDKLPITRDRNESSSTFIFLGSSKAKGEIVFAQSETSRSSFYSFPLATQFVLRVALFAVAPEQQRPGGAP